MSPRSLTTTPQSPTEAATGSKRIIIETTEEGLEEYERNVVTTIHNLNVPATSLKKVQLACGAFHGIQTIVLAVVIALISRKSEKTWYLYSSLPYQSRETPKGLIPSHHEVCDYNLRWCALMITSLSSLNHLFFSAVCHDKYKWYIARNQNPFRYAEYTIAGSMVKVMIAQLVGVTDIHLLICLFTMSAMTMQLGSLHETMNAKALADGYPIKWHAMILGWLPHVTGWAIIIHYGCNPELPTYTWLQLLVFFILDNSFGILFVMQWTRYPKPFDGMYWEQK